RRKRETVHLRGASQPLAGRLSAGRFPELRQPRVPKIKRTTDGTDRTDGADRSGLIYDSGKNPSTPATNPCHPSYPRRPWFFLSLPPSDKRSLCRKTDLPGTSKRSYSTSMAS